jgi:hypothetical protein
MRALFPAVPMTILIPPAVSNPDNPARLNGSAALVAMYERVGPELGMAINRDADEWLTPHHVFEALRPAFPEGPMVSVRTPDGLHLTAQGADWYAAALLEVKPFVAPRPPSTTMLAPNPKPTDILRAQPTPAPTPTPTPTSS